MKQGQLETTFDAPLGKQPGNVGVSGDVGGEPIIDEEKNVKSGGTTEIVTPFNVVFNKKG